MSATPTITQPRASIWFEETTVVGIVTRIVSFTAVSSTHSTQEPSTGPMIVAAPPSSRIVQV